MSFDLTSIKNGNTGVLVSLYKEHRNNFIAWARNEFGVREEDAKDIFQDVITAFYFNVKEERLVSLDCDIRTYLYAIGKYKIINHQKKSARTVNLPLSQLINEDKQENMAEKKHDDDHTKEVIKQNLEKLPEKDRKILELYYFENKSMQEIADELGYKNANVAKKMKFESFKKLAEIFKKSMLLLIF